MVFGNEWTQVGPKNGESILGALFVSGLSFEHVDRCRGSKTCEVYT